MFKNKYVQIGTGVIIVIATFIFIINDFYGKDILPEDKNKITDTTTTKSVIGGVKIEGTGDYTVEIIDSEEIVDIEPPSLDRPVIISDSFDAEAQIILTNNIEELTEQLRASPDRVDLWLNLGVYRKIAGDYEGAIEAWEYVAETGPDSVNYVAYRNIGDVYINFLKDYEVAEVNLRRVISLNPSILDSYRMLSDLYRYSYKTDTDLAEQILLEGLGNNPESIDLMTSIAKYYKETEDIENAKKYYEQARDEAQKLGNTQLVDTLTTEINNL